MRGITLKQWVLVVSCLLMPWAADAAGLGRLSVLSELGQPLNAEIDLVSVEKDELATLSARLASPDAYKQANFWPGAGRPEPEHRTARRPAYIKVTSTRPVNEPFIDLMVEITWASGRITRDTALIDPQDSHPQRLPPPKPVAPRSRRLLLLLRPAPPEGPPLLRPQLRAAGIRSDKTGETLFSIASDIKPEGVTLEQTLVGLYRSNPDAFENNMNRMKKGKILRKTTRVNFPRSAAGGGEKYVCKLPTERARRKLADVAGMAESRPATSANFDPDRRQGGSGRSQRRVRSRASPRGRRQAGHGGGRIRTLEEEAIAREKTEQANSVSRSSKTIKDMQRLLEIKSPAWRCPTKAQANHQSRSGRAARAQTGNAAAANRAAKPAATAATLLRRRKR